MFISLLVPRGIIPFLRDPESGKVVKPPKEWTIVLQKSGKEVTLWDYHNLMGNLEYKARRDGKPIPANIKEYFEEQERLEKEFLG